MNTSKLKLFIALIFILIFIDVFFMLSQNQLRWNKKFGSSETDYESEMFSIVKPNQKGSINFMTCIWASLITFIFYFPAMVNKNSS